MSASHLILIFLFKHTHMFYLAIYKKKLFHLSRRLKELWRSLASREIKYLGNSVVEKQ